MHNFHLTGGGVDESDLGARDRGRDLRGALEPGEYTFECDPHPPMTGSFTVT